MNKILMATAGVLFSTAMAPAAYAANTFYPGDPQFQVTGDPFSGTVSANIGDSGIAKGAFTDIFSFALGQTGLGSGSIATSSSIFGDLTDLDLTSVTVNGMAATRVASPQNLYESYFIFGVPITAGEVNNITVSGISRGNGSFGGNLTFIPSVVTSVPESSTWIMMILGFGMAGAAMRYRRNSTKVAYA
uniref:FxDxF family PEP-CTERM protein n=1 Tax=uncultured Sphingomonas sp. TaxID=158754 RepID=UPI0035CC03D2